MHYIGRDWHKAIFTCHILDHNGRKINERTVKGHRSRMVGLARDGHHCSDLPSRFAQWRVEPVEKGKRWWRRGSIRNPPWWPMQRSTGAVRGSSPPGVYRRGVQVHIAP